MRCSPQQSSLPPPITSNSLPYSIFLHSPYNTPSPHSHALACGAPKACPISRIKIPLKPNDKLIELVKYLIPQKSFNHACVIKRESNNLNKKELRNLIRKIEGFFNCKVRINGYSGAYYVHSTDLALFLNHFFIYEKGWNIMNQNELNNFYDDMVKFLGGDQLEELLPFEKIKRELFVKKDSETNWSYGLKPEERPVDELINYSVINLNKPAGPS